MGFSNVVKIVEVNDFISPSQDCVVNLNSNNPLPQVADNFQDEIIYNKKGTLEKDTIATKDTSKIPVKISLKDCLACSGCVTSAETVLLEQQSYERLLSKLNDPTSIVSISISQQSAASFGAKYHLSINQVFLKLSSYFRSIGAKVVFDIGVARDIALIETAKEFISSYRLKEDSSTRPKLTTACPGWVCYAEKSHGYALQHMSSVKSPQAIMGTLIKRFWARKMNIPYTNVFHCSIMPCFDKKLEAVRADLVVPASNVAETDLVLSTLELENLFLSKNVKFKDLPCSFLDCLTDGQQLNIYGVNGNSGGYMEYTYRQAALELFNVHVPSGPLPFKMIRNSDLKEVSLEVNGVVKLRFACAYGFRNIQSTLLKLKRKGLVYDFVEIMACPSGCTNGGGQLKFEQMGDLKEAVNAIYHGSEVDKSMPETRSQTMKLYSEWLDSKPNLDGQQDCLHASFQSQTVQAPIKDW